MSIHTYHGYVANLAGPSFGALTGELVSDLSALTVVLTGLQRAPIHDLLASSSLKSSRAEALVLVIAVAAGGAVLAWVRIASVDPRLAVGPRVSVRAVAFVLVDEILAGAAVHARTVHALVDVDFASFAFES